VFYNKEYNFKNTIKKDVGALCSWYTPLESPSKFLLDEICTTHEYISVKAYLCTLTYKCFQEYEDGHCSSDSITKIDMFRRFVATTKLFTLTPNTLSEIEKLVITSTPSTSTSANNGLIIIQDTSEVTVENMWVRCGSIILRKKRQARYYRWKRIDRFTHECIS